MLPAESIVRLLLLQQYGSDVFLRLIQFHLPVLRYSHDFWMLTPEQVSNYLRGYGVCPEHLVPENRLATLKAAVGYYEKFI